MEKSDKTKNDEEFFDYDEFLTEEEEEERRIILEETDFWDAYDEAFKPYCGGCSGSDKQK